MAYKTLQDAFVGPQDATVTNEQLQKTPYAVSYIRLGKAPRAMVVLASVKGAERSWVSADKEYVVTRYGRVVRTSGLERNIAGVSFDGKAPFSHGLESLKEIDYHASGIIDLMPAYHFGLAFKTFYKNAGIESIDVNGNRQSLTRVDEDYTIPALKYHVTNHYWLNEKGIVVKSVQQPIPEFASFQLTLLKPYAKDM